VFIIRLIAHDFISFAMFCIANLKLTRQLWYQNSLGGQLP